MVQVLSSLLGVAVYIKQSESSDVIRDGESGESSQSPSTSKTMTPEQINSGPSSSGTSVPSKPMTVEPTESTEGGQSSSSTSIHSRLAAALERAEQVVRKIRVSIKFMI